VKSQLIAIALTTLKKIYWFLFIDDLNGSTGRSYHEGEHWKKKLMKDVAGLVLFSYMIFVFNPLMPIVADLMAHTFWEKQHLASEHKMHGKNHVYTELANAVKQSDKDKSTSNTKSDSDEFVHVVSKSGYNFSNNYVVRKQLYHSLNLHYPITYLDNDDRPPQV